MPFMAPTNDPATALGGLGSILFPDPSRVAQAQYAGAHARKAEAETQQLNQQNIAANAMAQTIAAAIANPNQETIGAAVSTALQAGKDPAQVLRGALAAHQAAGSPGGPRMAQQLSDTISSMVGGTPFANTQTGFNTHETNETKRAQIAVGPQYARVGLERDVANNNRIFVGQDGNRIVVPMGQPIPAGAMPEDTSKEFGRANIAIQPEMQKQRREDAVVRDTPQVSVDPNTGQTSSRRLGDPAPPPGFLPAEQGAPVMSSIISSEAQRVQQARETEQWRTTPQPHFNPTTGETYNYLPGGPMPPPGFMPVQQGGPIMSSRISAAPGWNTSDKPQGFVIPDPSGRQGQVVTYARPSQGFPQGGLPLEPNNPGATMGAVGLFGQRSPAGQNVTVAPAEGDSGMGLGGLITGSGGVANAGQLPPPAAPAGPQSAGGGVPDLFDSAANSMRTSLGNVQSEPITQDKAYDQAIERHVEQDNRENNRGLGVITHDFELSSEARSALVARASQLQRDRRNLATYNNASAALDAAWAELAPTWQRDPTKLPWNGSSFLRPPQQGGKTGPVPATSQPPAPPAGLSALLSGAGQVTGTGDALAPTAAPQAAPSGALPWQPNPGARQPGRVYLSADGTKRALWTQNQTWQAVP